MVQSPLPSVFHRVTPRLSLEARRLGLFLPALEPGGAKGPFSRQPSHGLSFPSIQPGELPPSGITLQDGLWEFPLCPDTHSWSLNCLLGPAQPGLNVLGYKLFQDARRCQVLSLNHQPLFSMPPDLCREEPQTPLLWVCGGAMEPAGPRLSQVRVLGLAH